MLILDIESTASSFGLGEDALDGDGRQQLQNVWSLQNQVHDLQARLDQLQVTMLDVMGKYGDMAHLEVLTTRNLSMGSLLIVLPFAPGLRTLSIKYSGAAGGGGEAPNLTDALFQKIFARNKFQVGGNEEERRLKIIFNDS